MNRLIICNNCFTLANFLKDLTPTDEDKETVLYKTFTTLARAGIELIAMIQERDDMIEVYHREKEFWKKKGSNK